jgi:Mycothiol maleylpyruvate isomerase N-terminal domain
MRIGEMPVVDVRGQLAAQRRRLLDLLASLGTAQWAASTVAPQWSVKDIALHLLDVDLSWIARDRDHDQSGTIAMPSGHHEFVSGLARRNERWVEGARVLSPPLITDLLRWAGEQLDAHLASLDLTRLSSVYWAGDVPLWFDLAREFTERWVHYRQIQEAAVPAGHDRDQDEYLPLVLRTFIWGYPHQYREPAPVGTAVALEIADIGSWTLTRAPDEWILDEGQAAKPAVTLWTTGEAAWRLLTGARYEPGQVRLTGDPALAAPLLRVRGIIA